MAFLESILTMIGVQALDDIFKGDRSTVTNNITRLAAQLRGKDQAVVDKIYDQLMAIPGSSNFTGVIKEAMLRQRKDLSSKYKQAKENQIKNEAAITAAEANAMNYENQSGIGGLFNTAPEEKAKASQTELENLLKVENKA